MLKVIEKNVFLIKLRRVFTTNCVLVLSMFYSVRYALLGTFQILSLFDAYNDT